MTGTQSGEPGAGKPPRLAQWLLSRVLPIGKRGESIRGDLLEEFHRLPAPGSLLPASVTHTLPNLISR